MTRFWSIERGHRPVNITGRLLVAAIGVIALCVPAAAQVTMPPAARGLFGSGSSANAKTTLDLSVSLIEAYDSDESGLASPLDPVRFRGGGFSTLLDTGAAYAWRGKAKVGANVNTVLRHYAALGATESVGHRAGIGLSTGTVGGGTLFVNQSAVFRPAHLYGLFPGTSPLEPGDPGVTAPNYMVSDFESYEYTTSMSLGHGIGRRSSVTATGEFRYTDRVQQTETWRDISSYTISGQYSRNTTRNMAFSTELRYRSGQFGYSAGGTTTELALDAGFEYSRPFSATRSATLAAHVGVSGADYPGNSLGLTGFQRQYRVVGDVAFDYPLSLTWTARGTIRRGLEYETDLPTPVVSNGATVSVSGLLTTRVDLGITAGYVRGESILDRDVLFYDTYIGQVTVRYALSRSLAFFGEYLYYYYDFQNGQLLLRAMPSHLERNGARAGLTLWMPALRR